MWSKQIDFRINQTRQIYTLILPSNYIFCSFLIHINSILFRQKMSKFFTLGMKFLQKFDLFPTSKYLRYRQQAQFKTATGGFVSLILFGFFFLLFYNMGMQTLHQQIINGTTSYTMQVDPQSLTFSLKNSSDFMFSIGISGLNLSDPSSSYFNITMSQNFYSPVYQIISSTVIPLVQCTPEHYSFDQVLRSMFYRFSLNQSLCPPLYHEFVVGGRVISDIYAQLSINIQYCNKTMNSKCLNDTEMDALEKKLGGFTLVIPTIGTIVNPADQNYKQVYLEDRNFYQFSTTQGLWINAQIQEYEIDTDASLMPYQQIQTQYIPSIPGLFQVKNKPVFDNVYAQIFLTKSSISTTYTRNFNKIDQYFSYVGGLISTFLTIFWIFSVYSQQCFTIDIAEEIYTLTEDSSHSCYNFLYFILVNVKSFLNCIGVKCQWKKSDRFIHALHEMEKQVSVEYLLKRINFLQQGLFGIYNEGQLESLYKSGKKSIMSATKVREKYHEALENKKIYVEEKDGQLTAAKMVRESSPNNHQNTIIFSQTQSIHKFSDIRLVKDDQNRFTHFQKSIPAKKEQNAQRQETINTKEPYPLKHHYKQVNKRVPLQMEIVQRQRDPPNNQPSKVANEYYLTHNQNPTRQFEHYQFEDLN